MLVSDEVGTIGSSRGTASLVRSWAPVDAVDGNSRIEAVNSGDSDLALKQPEIPDISWYAPVPRSGESGIAIMPF